MEKICCSFSLLSSTAETSGERDSAVGLWVEKTPHLIFFWHLT